jgi:hypothetical protein
MIAILDVEGPLRDWLKVHPDLAELSGQHVYLGAAQQSSTPIPYWLELSRMGGGPDLTASPLDLPLMTFHCYGRTRLQASQLAHALANILDIGTSNAPVVLPGLSILYSRVTLLLWQPDAIGAKDLPRYIVDATMCVKPA